VLLQLELFVLAARQRALWICRCPRRCAAAQFACASCSPWPQHTWL